MKFFLHLFMMFFLMFGAQAQHQKSVFHKGDLRPNYTAQQTGAISYIIFSKSVNGPFTNTVTIYPGDSLFTKMNVTPLGEISAKYYIDINENGTIDVGDPSIGADLYVDNNTSSPGIIDLDHSAGVIVAYINPESPPSMHVLVRATEGLTSEEGTIIFENMPASYQFTGYVYEYGTTNPLPGVWIFAEDSSKSVGDATDINGFFTIPLEAGTYYARLQDMSGRFSSFDTVMNISGNTSHNFYLSALTSYIRGYVRDESSNPMSGVRIWTQNGIEAYSDLEGMYKLMVPTGYGSFGISEESVLPDYLSPISHNYSIGDNDSIVNNAISNFTCYTANDMITGLVKENGGTATRQYKIYGWSNEIQCNTAAVTDLSGNYSLPVHNSVSSPTYYVDISNRAIDYPILPGHYPDTNYFNLPPGAVANFNLISAETSATDPFYGDQVSPNYMMWDSYQYGSPWGVNSMLSCVGNRLKVNCSSTSGLSGLGLMSNKPYGLSNREFRIYADPSEMLLSDNTIKIVLSNENRNWEHPQFFQNSLQLIWEKSNTGLHQWRLVKVQNGIFTNLCTSYDSTGQHILMQFIDPGTLKLTIGGVVYYNGPWGNMISMAYVYLTQFNLDPNEPTASYFDEFVVGHLGTTGVGGPEGSLAKDYRLDQNYPNPFNPSSDIQYYVPQNSFISLRLFNILGQEVMVLVNEARNAGTYNVSLNASRLPSGVYYYQMTAKDNMTGKILVSSTQKAVVIK